MRAAAISRRELRALMEGKMSARRFFRELAVFLGVVGGATIGYCAGIGLPDSLHLTAAFLGLAVGYASVDLCLHPPPP